MKMKYIFGVALTSVMFASCSEDIMDHINKDEAHPSININAKLQLTDAEVATVYSTLCGNYVSVLILSNSSVPATTNYAWWRNETYRKWPEVQCLKTNGTALTSISTISV